MSGPQWLRRCYIRVCARKRRMHGQGSVQPFPPDRTEPFRHPTAVLASGPDRLSAMTDEHRTRKSGARRCPEASRPGWLRVACASVLLTTMLIVPGQARAQSGSLRGLVVDSSTRAPVVGASILIGGTSRTVLTNDHGVFSFQDVPAGSYVLGVSHIAYGDRKTRVEVVAGQEVAIRLALSPSAIHLEPLNVVVPDAPTPGRAQGTRQNVVTRDEIESSLSKGLGVGDVLQQRVPGVHVRRQEKIVGGDICIELRSIRATEDRACHSPAVFLNGVPINNPTTLYSTLSLEMIESMEVVQASEAGVRYGTGAMYGALLIETRRPGAARTLPTRGLRPFDWTLDPRPHPFSRAFAYSLVGSAAGLALGVTAANQCIALRSPAKDSIITKCDTWPTVGSAVAAMVLPALGGAFGASLGGKTHLSKGMVIPAAVGATMALMPGYALAISSERQNSNALGAIAGGLLTLGVPLAASLSDRLYRSLRH